MDRKTFESSMRQADIAKLSAGPFQQSFWLGYARGLRRLFHGESFSTPDQHLLWLDCESSDDVDRAHKGHGYRCGFHGMSPTEAAGELEKRPG